MTSHNYHIGTGFHQSPGAMEFFGVWLENTLKHSEPKRITVLSDSGSMLPLEHPLVLNLNLQGDLGHFMKLVNGEKPYALNGWSGTIITLAMIAYCDEADFVFVEQDCLFFGPCIERMYDELGTAKAIWGNCSFMPCEQSLFLVMHDQIPEFVKHYLDGPPQNREGEFGEDKFKRMEEKYPEQYKRFSFGVGRDRPITPDAEVWYAQKYSAEELAMLKAKGLI